MVQRGEEKMIDSENPLTATKPDDPEILLIRINELEKEVMDLKQRRSCNISALPAEYARIIGKFQGAVEAIARSVHMRDKLSIKKALEEAVAESDIEWKEALKL